MNNAYSRPGPSFGALFGINEQLQDHLESPDDFAERFNEPPPSYHSPSHSPSYSHSQASFQEAHRAEEDDPETLDRLAREARAIPFLWEQYKYDGWTREEIQRDIDAWKRLGEETERRKIEEKQLRFRLLTTGPTYGLFEDNGSSSGSEPTKPLQEEGTVTRKRKRRRTQAEILLEDVQEAASSNRQIPKRVCRNQLNRKAKGTPNKMELNTSLPQESKAAPRRSKRIANMVEAKSNALSDNPTVKIPRASVTKKKHGKHQPSPKTNPSRQTSGKVRKQKGDSSTRRRGKNRRKG